MKFQLDIKKKKSAKSSKRSGSRKGSQKRNQSKKMATLDYVKKLKSYAPVGSIIKMTKGPFKGLEGKVMFISASGMNVLFETNLNRSSLISMSFLKNNPNSFKVIKKHIPRKQQKQDSIKFLRGYNEQYVEVDDDDEGEKDYGDYGDDNQSSRPLAKIKKAQYDAEGNVIRRGRVEVYKKGDIIGEDDVEKKFDLPGLFMDILTEGKDVTVSKQVYEDINNLKRTMTEMNIDKNNMNILKTITVARILFMLNEKNPDYVADHFYHSCIPEGYNDHAFNNHYFISCVAESSGYLEPLYNDDGAEVMDVNSLVANFVNLFQTMDKNLKLVKLTKSKKVPKVGKQGKSHSVAMFAPPKALKLHKGGKKGVKAVEQLVVGPIEKKGIAIEIGEMKELDKKIIREHMLYNNEKHDDYQGREYHYKEFEKNVEKYKELYDKIQPYLTDVQNDTINDKLDNFENMMMKMLFGDDFDQEDTPFEELVKQLIPKYQGKGKQGFKDMNKEIARKLYDKNDLTKEQKNIVKAIIKDPKVQKDLMILKSNMKQLKME